MDDIKQGVILWSIITLIWIIGAGIGIVLGQFSLLWSIIGYFAFWLMMVLVFIYKTWNDRRM